MSKNKGITLIALVITIIVLLILAGISIAMLIGENGLLGKANTAKEEHKIAQYKEEINLIVMEEIAERKTETKTEPMIVSLENKIKEKDWGEKTSKEKQDGDTAEYLIVESKEGYEFIIEVDNEKETAKIIETNKTPGEKYTITYHPNGGTGEERTVEVRKGFYKILEKNTFTKTDYIFGGWCEDINGNSEKYLEGSKYHSERNVTLYAIWTYNGATINFNANTGIGEMESKNVIKGETAILPVNSFTKKGYDFEKWNTKADGTGIDYEESGNIVVTEDSITLYAIWKNMTVESAIKKQEIFEENTPILDEYENQIVIPEGFKIASDSAKDVTGGIVIEDAIGNQFVWIPVGTVYTNKEHTQSKTIELNRYTFASNGAPTKQGSNIIENAFQEVATSSTINSIAIDIEAFKTRTNNNHGYYMGRYEAGRSNTEDTSKGANDIVCKEDRDGYKNSDISHASRVARKMYTNKKFTSDLINSYAWDTAIVFIQSFSGDGDYAMQKPIQSSIAKTGQAIDGTNKDVRCNIYDMAGNYREWTTEISTRTFSYVFRGGNAGNSNNYTSHRNQSNGGANANCAFRPILYL